MAYTVLLMMNGIVFVALLSRLVSVQEFAAWNWVLAMVGLLVFSDLYLFLSLQNAITRAISEKRTHRVALLFHNFLFLHAAVSLIFIPVLLPVIYFMPIPLEISSLSWISLGLMVSFFLASLAVPFLVVSSAYGGNGDTDLFSRTVLIRMIAQNAVVLLFLMIGGWVAIAIPVYFLVGLAGSGIVYWYCARYYGLKWRLPSKRKLRLTARLVLGEGQPIAWATLKVLDSIKINFNVALGLFFVSVTVMADYILISRLSTLVVSLMGSIMVPIVPRILTLRVAGDNKGLKDLVSKAVMLLVSFGVAASVGLVVFGGPASSLWAGRTIAYDPGYAGLIALAAFTQLMSTLFWNILMGFDEPFQLTMISLVSTIAYVLSLVLLIHQVAELALPLATAIGGTVFSLGAGWRTYQHIRVTSRNSQETGG